MTPTSHLVGWPWLAPSKNPQGIFKSGVGMEGILIFFYFGSWGNSFASFSIRPVTTSTGSNLS
jgi:hypothetical protein